jgi:hypothetical protein
MNNLVRSLLVFVLFVAAGVVMAAAVLIVPLFFDVPATKVHGAMFAAVCAWTVAGICFTVLFYRRIS